ncbi:cytochrome P450 87A3-like [Cucurbita maxima]|uniref:Cytochrome P450 87A3-like n=1 Tax=Cucurbita maxima TaxID=3661 RepID=A0A6J1K5M4_CUCMA|nr:cytochrome P450 87A3-like [Cucurbita maxima]
MWTIVVGLATLAVAYYIHWINKWKDSKFNGVLPPGTMGLPLIGETLQLSRPSDSLDVHPFIKKKVKRYGSIFKTCLAGRPVVVSTDAEFNNYIMLQEGRAVEMWYLDTLSKFFGLDTEWLKALGFIHKYIRSITLNHFGAESLRERFLPRIEESAKETLCYWATQPSVEVKDSAAVMVFRTSMVKMVSKDSSKLLTGGLTKKFTGLLGGFLTLPINVPGTTYNKCMKDMKEIQKKLREILEGRLASGAGSDEDFLGQAVKDKGSQKFISDDFIIQLLFSISFASFESISTTLTLILNYLADHPDVVKELEAEHEAIRNARADPDGPITWEEYKSMTFTLHVIFETLRLGSVTPALLRKTTKELQINGYTIPEGWTVMLVTASRHRDPAVYKDPHTFNPWRWKELDSITIQKNFMPFGGGLRHCAGAEYSKVYLCTFLHILFTKYRWTKLKGGKVARAHILSFEDGLHMKFTPKE